MSSDSASILVVEDDDFYREYLGELLKSRGLEVRWLADGSVVCRQVEGEPPDLIILDLFMTGRDGISITRELKSNPATWHIPIIILTGSVEHSDLIRCLESGADDFINKNCKGYELFLRINAHLRVKRLHDELRIERDNLNTILDVTRTASSSLDYKKMLDLTVHRLTHLLGLALCDIVQLGGASPVLLSTSRNDEIFEQEVDAESYPGLLQVERTHEAYLAEAPDTDGLHVAIVPLISAGLLLGALYLRSPRPFGENDLKICTGIADSVANVLKNAQLYIHVLAEKNRLEEAYQQKYEELDESNRKLAEAVRLKDDFLSICSHDIKSPLHIMLGHTSLLLSGRMGDLDQTQHRSLQAVRRQGSRVLKMVDDLLELRKVQDERIELTLVRGHLERQIADWCEQLAPESRERGVTLQFDPPAGEIVLKSDWVLLREMVWNLVQNAIKFSHDDGCVRVSVLRAGDMAVISVSDDGIGISEDERARIFERFYTGRRPGIKRGTGLGLAIVKSIVERLGGYLTVESVLNEGSTFNAHLPILAEEEIPVSIDREFDAVPRHKILTIDDEEDARELIRVLLEKKFELFFAEDGMLGVIRAREFRPDLILMDLNMPRLDGLEATRRLKSNLMTRNIPIIMVSSTRDQHRKLECFTAGADDFVHKPFEPAELEARIRVHLRT
ncbi:MAG: response regulator [Myxococcales bacterium]|nr:response regulator [Myxococcales bacterium]